MREGGVHLRKEGAGTDGVDDDPGARQFKSQGARELGYRTLARGIGGSLGYADQPDGTGKVDDTAPAHFTHGRNDRPAAEPGTSDVNPHDLLELLEAQVPDRAPGIDSSAVDENSGVPEPLPRGGEHAFYLSRLGDIRLQSKCFLSVFGGKFLRGGMGFFGISAHKDKTRACRGKPCCHYPAQSLGSAGHESGAALKVKESYSGEFHFVILRWAGWNVTAPAGEDAGLVRGRSSLLHRPISMKGRSGTIISGSSGPLPWGRPVRSEVFFASVAQPLAEDLGDSPTLSGGKPLVEIKRPIPLAAAGLVAMGLPVSTGNPKAAAGFLEEGRTYEILIAFPVLPGWHDAPTASFIGFGAVSGKAADAGAFPFLSRRVGFVMKFAGGVLFLALSLVAPAGLVRIATFEVDATPPVGSPLAYDSMTGVGSALSCRGLVLLGAGDPIVLGAIDWIGLSNDGQLEFRKALARGARTQVARVAMHSLHQHDAPRCDFSANALLEKHGAGGRNFNVAHARKVIEEAAGAAREALKNAQPVTHVGLGSAEVGMVASNRRILGPDGKVQHMRFSATGDPEIRAFPAGTIDPRLCLVTFWNGDEALAALSYYATHPQSYYRTGLVNPDFPGMARNQREKETGVRHIHFTGAAGDIGAGKWNDGNHRNRQILADRVAAGMKAAWESTEKTLLTSGDVGWKVESVVLPVGQHMKEETLAAVLEIESEPLEKRYLAAKALTWLRRCQRGEPIELSCLSLRQARILHMPGELFVEYQLYAQAVRPDLFVAMAAYGDYAPGYICTAAAYTEGGYEAAQRSSMVSPAVEATLKKSIRRLVDAPGTAPASP